jgi:hypothetical protein
MTQSCKSSVRDCDKTVLVISLLVLTVSLQGCLAAAWVAAVSADSLQTSDVTFEPFEQSWVSLEKPAEMVDHSSLSSVAVWPIEGDKNMGSRLIDVLQRQTALHVVTPRSPHRPVVLLPGESERAVLARSLSREFAVDAVLFAREAGTTSRASDWGWKEQESRRLFLYLVDRDGHLLWKDELPFTIVTGTKPAIEEFIQTDLSRHFMNHVRDLGLDALGYLPPRTS